MDFRTQIEIPHRQQLQITHAQGIVMLGSCFTDNIGEKLALDGFDVVHNPMGPLYNPHSILDALSLVLFPEARKSLLLMQDDGGITHCLNFASRYQDQSADALLKEINAQLDTLAQKIHNATHVIITLGTAFVFSLIDRPAIVGNCHKFNANMFERTRMTVQEVASCLHTIVSLLPNEHVIFTISPIRHTADGLHGNQLSKSVLQLAVDEVVDNERVHYFPAYEIALDDLRDYRFFAADMKHPSPVAVDYIYEIFAKYYFSNRTVEEATARRKQNLRLAHRPIL